MFLQTQTGVNEADLRLLLEIIWNDCPLKGCSARVAMTWHAGHRHNSLEDLFSFRRAIPAGVTLLSTSSRPPLWTAASLFDNPYIYIYIFFFPITYRNSSWYSSRLVPLLQGIVRPHLFWQDIFVSTLSMGRLQLFLVMDLFLLSQPSQG